MEIVHPSIHIHGHTYSTCTYMQNDISGALHMHIYNSFYGYQRRRLSNKFVLLHIVNVNKLVCLWYNAYDEHIIMGATGIDVVTYKYTCTHNM